MKKKLFLAIFISFCIILFGKPVLAATYYVAQLSAGNQSGSSYQNRMSVSQHNSRTFAPGDIIYLTGTISSRITPPSSGSSGNPITYRGDYPGSPVDINFNGNPQIWITGKSHLVFDSLTMRNGEIGISTGPNTHHLAIRNCEIHTMKSRGLLITDYTFSRSNSHVLIENNEIYNIGINTAGADISIASWNHFIIRNNRLYSNTTAYGIDGIMTESSSYGLIEYNHIHSHNRTSTVGDDAGEDGIDLKMSTNNVIIRYNRIYNHQYQSGITVQMGSNNIDIYGNSISDSNWAGVLIMRGTGQALHAQVQMQNINVFNNIIYDNAGGVNVQWSSTSFPSGVGPIRDVRVYNNTIVNNGSRIPQQYAGVMFQEGNGHQVMNNIFYGNSGPPGSLPTLQARIHSTSGVLLDNNRYFAPSGSGGNLFQVGSTNYKLAGIQGLGQEANGTLGDPLFMNVGANDFRLSEGSPCIGASLTINGSPSQKTIHGVKYNPSYAFSLGVETDFDLFPPFIVEREKEIVLGTEIGAFMFETINFKVSDDRPSPPKNLKSIGG